VLRGANVSADAKEADDFLPGIDEEELRSLHDDLGLNAIRLLVFWEAIEPMPGVYDDAYLEAVRAIAEAAGRQRLQVIVDMHQDVYGRGFGHAGAPRWACDERLYHSFVEPDEWYMGYLEPEVKACFDQLYEEGPTREAFLAAWGRPLAVETIDQASLGFAEPRGLKSYLDGTRFAAATGLRFTSMREAMTTFLERAGERTSAEPEPTEGRHTHARV